MADDQTLETLKNIDKKLQDTVFQYDPDKHLSESKYFLERGRIIGLLDARIIIKQEMKKLDPSIEG